jgi:hypothetical protein
MALAPAPPYPDGREIAGIFRDLSGSSHTPWRLTGAQRFRRNLFGHVVMWVEEERYVHKPVTSVRSPNNWQQERRWRRARMRDL